MAVMEIDDEKNELRKLCLSRRRAMLRQDIEQQSSIIEANILKLDAFRQAKTVMCYVSMRDEVQVEHLMKRLLAESKRVCIPYIRDSAGQMDAVEVSCAGQLVKGPFDILTVDNESPTVVSAGMIDFIIVPGVAFDRQGGRLGMGSGFYDRFLPLAVKATVAGLAFSCQISDHVPCLPYDCLMDYVVTEEEIIDCKTGKM